MQTTAIQTARTCRLPSHTNQSLISAERRIGMQHRNSQTVEGSETIKTEVSQGSPCTETEATFVAIGQRLPCTEQCLRVDIGGFHQIFLNIILTVDCHAYG